ncbi:hypothetical protein HJC99_04435 [Candidatus Saccharibacteria bacterium]|nr:hypothetical protein [Candidatus Saccharibacteria bacterium]
MKFVSKRLIFASIAAILVEFGFPVLSGVAQAAPPPGFQQTMVRLDRMAALTATGGTVCATPSVASTEASVDVKMPNQPTGTNFTVNATAANWTVTTTNLPLVPVPSGSPATYTLTAATAWPGIGTATSVSGHDVIFPSGDLTVGTPYCFNFSDTSTLTTGSAGYINVSGSITTLDSGSAVINESEYATSVITNDQITVTAVVPPNFQFSLDGNADTFTTDLSPTSVVSTGGRLASVITNAKGGWIMWAKDSQAGLYSTAANYTIATTGAVDGAPSTLTANGATEGYVMDVVQTVDAAGGCVVAEDPEYYGNDTTGGSPTNNKGGTLDKTNFQPIASCTGTSPATSNGDTIEMIERAIIAGGTPAGSDYSDIITVVGAGNF